MTPNGGGLPTGDLLAAIEATFGTLKNLKLQ
jgi:Fe-Mn family superoxide dismutase